MLFFAGISQGMVSRVTLPSELGSQPSGLYFWLQQEETQYNLPYTMDDQDALLQVAENIPIGTYQLYGAQVSPTEAHLTELTPLVYSFEVLAPAIVSIQFSELTAGKEVSFHGLYFGSAPNVYFYPAADSAENYACTIKPESLIYTNQYESGNPVGAMDVDTGESRVTVTLPADLPAMTLHDPRFTIVSSNSTGSIFAESYTNSARGQFFAYSPRDSITTNKMYDYLINSMTGGEGGLKKYFVELLINSSKLYDQVYNYDLRLFTVLYWTIDGNGNPVPASGVVAMPAGLTNAPLLSFQHGTMLTKAEAPTMANGAEMAFATTYAASEGFITSIPDHIGQGVAAQIYTNFNHPYCQAAPIAWSDADMITALNTFLGTAYDCQSLPERSTLNGKAYLAGYSEGGYATMGLQRELEAHPGKYGAGTLVTTTPLSGPYAITQVMLPRMMSDEPFRVAYFAAFLLVTLNNDYHIYKSGSDYFAQPYATTVPSLIDGYHDSSLVNAAMPEVIKTCLLPEVQDQLTTQIGPVMDGLLPNNLVGLEGRAAWEPVAPMLLVHGHTDDCVIYGNSVVATNYFIGEMGCTNVSLLTVPENDLIKVGANLEPTHVLYAPYVVGESWKYIHDVNTQFDTSLPRSRTVSPPVITEEEKCGARRSISRSVSEKKEVQP